MMAIKMFSMRMETKIWYTEWKETRKNQLAPKKLPAHTVMQTKWKNSKENSSSSSPLSLMLALFALLEKMTLHHIELKRFFFDLR